MRKGVLLRRTSQIFFLLLFLFILWSTTYPLKGFVSPEVIFALDPLDMLVTSVAERLLLAGVVASLLMLVLALVLGRFFCGWVCPLGTMIDCVPQAAGGPGARGGTDAANRKRAMPKFLLLAAIGALALAGIQAAWLFDPLVIAARFVSLNLIPAVTILFDRAFEAAIRASGFFVPLYDLYRSLRGSFLGIDPRFFSHSLVIFSFFCVIMAGALFLRRGWCRCACPLGALYALCGRSSLLKRRVENCSSCGRCSRECPMAAIKEDLSTAKGECIVCLNCVYTCPQNKTRFTFGAQAPAAAGEGGISRRQFLMFALISAVSPGPAIRKRKQRVIRPPAALEEQDFVQRCIRCGNCMKVCITNGLQPVALQSGPAGIWTPQLVPEIGYCEYRCTLCGNVCPTGAIPRLTEQEKKKTRLGLALIDRKVCLPWKESKECLVCEEHCPVSKKAIKFREYSEKGKLIKKPYVDPRLCIGCAICQTKCPTRPRRAIIVYPVKVDHGMV